MSWNSLCMIFLSFSSFLSACYSLYLYSHTPVSYTHLDVYKRQNRDNFYIVVCNSDHSACYLLSVILVIISWTLFPSPQVAKWPADHSSTQSCSSQQLSPVPADCHCWSCSIAFCYATHFGLFFWSSNSTWMALGLILFNNRHFITLDVHFSWVYIWIEIFGFVCFIF